MSDPAIFDAHCMALGRLCVAWATIDRQLNDLLGAMIGCAPATTACITTGTESVSARCDIMTRLVHIEPLSDAWASNVKKLLNHVSGDLAPKRNRLIHDYWSFADGTIVRLDRRASTAKQQSRKEIELTYDTEHVTPPDEVDKLTERVGQAAFLLHCAIRDVRDWKEHRWRVSPPLLSRAFDLPEVPDVLRKARPKR